MTKKELKQELLDVYRKLFIIDEAFAQAIDDLENAKDKIEELEKELLVAYEAQEDYNMMVEFIEAYDDQYGDFLNDNYPELFDDED